LHDTKNASYVQVKKKKGQNNLKKDKTYKKSVSTGQEKGK